MSKINYANHYIDEDDINSVIDVLKNEQLTQGKRVREFEAKIEEYTMYNYAVAVNSGTAALHIACVLAGIDFGDEVIIPSITFVATANAVKYCNGNPVFCDVNDCLLIEPLSVTKMITEKTKAIIAVDLGGQQCNYKLLRQICNKHNLMLIIDACHSFGLKPCEDADFVCYSFHPAKHITTGEGGAILCNNSWDSARATAIRNHGRWKTFDNQMLDMGYNYRMPDINAALGISQLNKIDRFLKARKLIAENYFKILGNITISQKYENAWHLYIIVVDERDKFLKYMFDNDIICNVHYIPVYEHQYYKKQNIRIDNSYTSTIKDNIVSIPIYPSLSYEDQSKIISLISKYVGL